MHGKYNYLMGNNVWVDESEIVDKDKYDAEYTGKENDPLWEAESLENFKLHPEEESVSGFKPGDKVTAYGGTSVGTIDSVEGDLLVVNLDGDNELYELSSDVVEKIEEIK